MLSLPQAQAAILQRISRSERRQVVALRDAVGKFVADSVTATVDNPMFDNSAMDGYALRVDDLARAGGKLPVVDVSACGDVPATLAAGTCMRIFTGAPLPHGADAVVMQEAVAVEGGVARFSDVVPRGDNIRRKGEDFRSGEVLYPPGRRLSELDVALLAAAGNAQVSVFAPPRVLVFATGDELVEPGTALPPGRIYESNRTATLLLLRALGADVVDGGIVKDDADALCSLLSNARDFDFVLTSGGASVGDRDLVKAIFAEIGTIDFWRVSIKPGKPLAFGRLGERGHFFALPGNPVSSLVTFKLFVEPAIVAWCHGVHRQLHVHAVAANDFHRVAGRTEFLRARLFTTDGQLMAEALPGQGSHMLGTLRATNGLIQVDADAAGFRAGDVVLAIPLTLSIA
jgi:molybdopterin molybdotransferase